MGTFCFDEYQHPLLWCEDKKRIVQKKHAEESLSQWRCKKAEEFSQKERDKREFRDLATTHCPWGRPGGGAPNVDIRRRDITVDGLQSTPGTKIIPGLRGSAFPSYRASIDTARGTGRSSMLRDHYCPPTNGIPEAGAHHLQMYDPVGNAGSQIRSAADRLYITLKDHPSMSFRNKGHVDIELRYKTAPKGKKTLEKIVVTEQEKCASSTTNKIKKSADEAKDEPWGKAGPGGKPWRNPKAVGKSFMRSMGWTDKELLKQMDLESKNSTELVRADNKNVKKKKSTDETAKNCCSICVCDCPAKQDKNSQQQQSGIMNKKSSSPKKKNSLKEYDKKSIKLSENKPLQKICPRLLRSCEFNKENVELVPLLAKRRGMHRPISLSSTDVTKRTADNRLNQYDGEYLKDLSNQMSQNRNRVKNIKQHEMALSSKHFETFENFWGRPGHGAPTDIRYKLNLDDLLYGSCIP